MYYLSLSNLSMSFEESFTRLKSLTIENIALKKQPIANVVILLEKKTTVMNNVHVDSQLVNPHKKQLETSITMMNLTKNKVMQNPAQQIEQSLHRMKRLRNSVYSNFTDIFYNSMQCYGMRF